MGKHRRRRRAEPEVADLDVTPFMNLMIVLVPVLLLSLVFTHTGVIDLDFPAASESVATEKPETPPRHLEVQVFSGQFLVADDRSVIQTIPRTEDGADYQQLTELMMQLKQTVPDKRDMMLLLEPGTDYQTLVSVMDAVREVSISGAEGAEDEVVELFPDLSLGDAPLPDNEVAAR